MTVTEQTDMQWAEIVDEQDERIAELEAAMEDIRNRILCPVGPSPTLDEIGEIALAALTKEAS